MLNRKRILSVTIKKEVDTDPDTSWMGEYSRTAKSDFTIDRAHSLDCIENDFIQQSKLERIADTIENDTPVCEEHFSFVDSDCAVCQEEKVYTQAMEQIRELAECDCGEHGDMEHNEYRYFNPSSNYVNEKGNPNHGTTPEEVRKYTLQDYDRMENLNRGHWCFLILGVVAKVSIPSGESFVKSTVFSYLGGMESDGGKDYIQETIEDLYSEVKRELSKLGFSKRAIAKAFETVEEEND